MTDLSTFDQNGASNPDNNIFGLPFTEDESRLIILPVPGVTGIIMQERRAAVIYSAEQVAFGWNTKCWSRAYLSSPIKSLLKSDYLRKEGNYDGLIAHGDCFAQKLHGKSLKVSTKGLILNHGFTNNTDRLKTISLWHSRGIIRPFRLIRALQRNMAIWYPAVSALRPS